MMNRDPVTPPRFEDLPDLCTPEQAQAFLQVGRNTIYELLKSGAIHSIRFGRLIRIPRRALVEQPTAVVD
jgi:excisionase family DNA binding protein